MFQRSGQNNSLNRLEIIVSVLSIFIPLLTVSVAGMAIFKESVMNNYFGIGIAATINQSAVIVTGFELFFLSIITILLIACPVNFFILIANHKKTNGLFLLPLLVGPIVLLTSDLDYGNLIRALVFLIMLLVLSIVTAGTLNSLKTNRDLTFREIARFGGIILTLVELLIFIFLNFDFRLNVLSNQDRSVTYFQDKNYLLLSKDNDKFLSIEICSDNTLAFGKFRYINIADANDIYSKRMNLKVSKC